MYTYTHISCYILAGNAKDKPWGGGNKKEERKALGRGCQLNTVYTSLTKNLTKAHITQIRIQLTVKLVSC